MTVGSASNTRGGGSRGRTSRSRAGARREARREAGRPRAAPAGGRRRAEDGGEGWSFFARASSSLTRARASSRTVADSSEFALSRTSRVATTRSSASVASSSSATRVGATAHGEVAAPHRAARDPRGAPCQPRPKRDDRPKRTRALSRAADHSAGTREGGSLRARGDSRGGRGAWESAVSRASSRRTRNARARVRDWSEGGENAARNALSVDLKSSLSSSRPRGEAK